MKRIELDRMMDEARSLQADADPQSRMLSFLVIICGEQLLQLAEMKKATAEFGPKLDATAKAIVDLEEKIRGKLALTTYNFGDER